MVCLPHGETPAPLQDRNISAWWILVKCALAHMHDPCAKRWLFFLLYLFPLNCPAFPCLVACSVACYWFLLRSNCWFLALFAFSRPFSSQAFCSHAHFASNQRCLPDSTTRCMHSVRFVNLPFAVATKLAMCWCLHSWRGNRPVARQSICPCQRLPVRSCQRLAHRYLWR